mmetsp:Transcript_10732/g.30687  ORF Transcript_10732/g.30687 Transcript_10732/m.30687 type:complete len:201 (+) Transcript_10732:723-1325(+)
MQMRRMCWTGRCSCFADGWVDGSLVCLLASFVGLDSMGACLLFSNVVFNFDRMGLIDAWAGCFFSMFQCLVFGSASGVAVCFVVRVWLVVITGILCLFVCCCSVWSIVYDAVAVASVVCSSCGSSVWFTINVVSRRSDVVAAVASDLFLESRLRCNCLEEGRSGYDGLTVTGLTLLSSLLFKCGQQGLQSLCSVVSAEEE